MFAYSDTKNLPGMVERERERSLQSGLKKERRQKSQKNRGKSRVEDRFKRSITKKGKNPPKI